MTDEATLPAESERRSGPKRVLIVVPLALLAILILVRLTGCAESLAYYPQRGSFPAPPHTEDVWFETPDGLRLHGWFMRAQGVVPGERAPAVLHLHGNAGSVQHHESFSRFLTGHGLHVLLFDYRGYGQSDQGKIRRDPLLRDAHAALDALLSRPDVDPNRVGVYGVSLGGAFALPLTADRGEVAALVTLSTFSTWRGVAHDTLPVIGPLIMPGGWDPEDRVRDLGDRPWLIVHGGADEIISARHAKRLERIAVDTGADASLFIAPGADHNTILETSSEARDRIAAFFVEQLGTGE